MQPITTGRLAPPLSIMRPAIWAAITNPRKKYSRNSPVSVDDLPNEIWAYSLAKKKIGTNTSIEMPSTRFSTKNGRILKMLTCISGSSVRCSTK